MSIEFKKFWTGIRLEEQSSDPSTTREGSIWFNSTSKVLKYFGSGAIRTAVSTDQTQTLTNKTIGDDLLIQGTTQSTDKDTGALIVEGGVGIEKNLYVGGNVDITGTLTVDNVNTINSTTLDVEDANVTVNKGGNQAAANSAVSGLTVEMSDATDARFGYDSTTTSKFKLGETASEAEVATISHTQTFTNKTLDYTAATGTNTITMDSDDAVYDNGVSGLAATDVKAALDELTAEKAETNLSNLTSPTAINQDLLPNGSQDLGASANEWYSVFSVINYSDAYRLRIGTTDYMDLSSNGATTSMSFDQDIPVIIQTNTSVSGVNSGAITIQSGANNFADQTGDVTLQSGSSSSTATTGNVLLKSGTTSGTRGNIQLQDGSEGTSGHVWSSTDTSGTGAWASVTSLGAANTSLSNLAATAINTSLISDTANTDSLGSTSIPWSFLYVSDIVLKDATNDKGVLGATSSAAYFRGSAVDIQLYTSDASGADSKDVFIYSGDTTTSGDSGDINITVGSAADTRGNIKLDSSQLELVDSGASKSVYKEARLDETLTNDVATTTLFSHASATYRGYVVDYTIQENSTTNVRTGRLFVVSDGTNADVSDTYVQTADVGVTWEASISGGNILLQYNTTLASADRTMQAHITLLPV